ncbi:ABC transporter permease [Microvirga sp. VF16]|uniref:ABC transporter permease n=1 Tax=Microvirga sp. VF16 TaxID=2807101 RepID=UPI00193D95F9|nr:ABC transporter permease [Microvirga sp. VF16]QRM33115.1 ABC transporter permease [Microvirga sp. VF16]
MTEAARGGAKGTRDFLETLRKALVQLGWAGFTLLFTSVLIFLLTHVMPGNAARATLDTMATAEAVKALEEQLGLNRTLLVQYWNWLSGVLQGDFGTSMRMNVPIGPVLADRLAISLPMAGAAFILVFILGTTLGSIAALYQGRPLDRLISISSLAGISAPEFVTGMILIILFAGVLPTSGFAGEGASIHEYFLHMVLPVATLTLILLAHVLRTSRVSMIEALAAPYTRTAVLKGLPKRTIVVKHVLRNALLPTITVLGINVGYLIGGVVIVETVFSVPGIGRLTVFAIQNRDIPLIQACTLAMAATYIGASLLTDVTYLILNPRLRGR